MCLKLLTASAMVMVILQVFAFAQADTSKAIDALDKALSQPSAPSPQSQSRRPIMTIEGQWQTDWGVMAINTIGGEINGVWRTTIWNLPLFSSLRVWGDIAAHVWGGVNLWSV